VTGTAVTRSVDGPDGPSAGSALAQRNEALSQKLDKAVAAEMWKGADLDSGAVKREVLLQCARDPNLHDCTLTSIADAARSAALAGLLPDGREGYLIAYNTKVGEDERGRAVYEKRASFMPSWRGLQSVLAEDYDFRAVTAEVVRDKDPFTWREGLEPVLEHTPVLNSDKAIIASYAVAFPRDGSPPIFVVCDLHDLNAATTAVGSF